MAKAKVAEYKKKYVKEYVKLMNDYPIVGVLNLANFPAGQLASMREKLRESVVIRMGKKRLYNLALAEAEKTKKDVTKLSEKFEKIQPALLFTKDNPFVLFKTLKKSKSKAFAKAGDIAPEDITIKAGPTSFTPGPIIGELGQMGLKTAVEDGKIAIKEDKVVAKAGDEITDQLASLLMRLDIKPMEIGLDLVAAYEDGFVFDKTIMSVDEQEYLDNITTCSRWAVNLSMEAGIITKDNAGTFITKAFNDSKALALSENILADAVLEQILAKAEGQMTSLKAELNLPDVVEEPKAEEKPAEEVKEEAPAEQPAEEKKEETPTEEPKDDKKESEEEEEEEEKEVVDYEAEQLANETKEEARGEGINKMQEAIDEVKGEDIPSVNDLCSQTKSRGDVRPTVSVNDEDEIDKMVNNLVREVKYRDVKKEEGDTEKIVDEINTQSSEQEPKQE